MAWLRLKCVRHSFFFFHFLLLPLPRGGSNPKILRPCSPLPFRSFLPSPPAGESPSVLFKLQPQLPKAQRIRQHGVFKGRKGQHAPSAPTKMLTEVKIGETQTLERHRLVAKLHQNAPHRTVDFKKMSIEVILPNPNHWEL